ncbi:MAG: HTTM domain-containing protein [Polyangiales bacterium]
MTRARSESLFDRYFFGPVDLLRPYLLVRALLALLAFDCWLELAPYGYRYGLGEFNVAHFTLLDALLPMPSPEAYVALMLGCGWLALAMALTGPTRVGLALLTLGYTLGWSWSLLDAYQHHYLLSLLLLAMTCFPETRWEDALAADLHAQPEDRDANTDTDAPRAWGYVLFCVSCSIVYFYTAITKMNADWRDGHALERLAGRSAGARTMVAFADAHGVGAEAFWSAFAKSAILIQLVIAAGFLLAPVIDRLPRLRTRRLLAFWVLAPLSFHAGAAHMDLKIGWFSEYMLLVAVVVFLPREILAGVAFVLGTPQRAVGRFLNAEEPADATAIGALLLAGVASLGLFRLVDLPGDQAAGLIVAVLGGVLVLRGTSRGDTSRVDTSRALPVALASLVGGAALVSALVASPARFDYYRKAGGDALRLASPEQPQYYLEALEHYRRAQRYYPDDYRAFWEAWDRDAAARVARGEPAPDERRAVAEGAPPRDRAQRLEEAEAQVANLRAQGLLPPE